MKTTGLTREELLIAPVGIEIKIEMSATAFQNFF
jgi:hypothetical protein